MVQKRTCDYTGEDIEPGTGTMFVRTDGTILWFKDSKAKKNYMMGRESRDLEWIGYEEAEETVEETESEETTEADEADSDVAEEADEEPAAEADDAAEQSSEAEEADDDSETETEAQA